MSRLRQARFRHRLGRAPRPAEHAVLKEALKGEPSVLLLGIQDLQVEFGSGPDAARAVDGVSLRLDAGRTLCLVGESGSGKSVTALSIAKLLPSPPARSRWTAVLCLRACLGSRSRRR